MNSAQRVISKFGGQRALATALGKPQSTIQYWARAGTIPAKWHAPLITLAQGYGVELYPGDFLDLPGSNGSESDAEAERAKPPTARWPGNLRIADVELPVYVLDDGRRVISRTGATDVITGGKGGGNLESYLNVEALRGYMPGDVSEQWFEFVIPQVTNKTVLGMAAETFLDICTAYVRALNDGALQTDRQRDIAAKAGMFLAACSKVGLVALIDEATGYQYERAEDALQFKLKLFLEEEMRKWESTFPDELWREFGRLTQWRGPIHSRPRYWGRLVMELIYGYLDPDVAEWLKKNNPKPEKGHNHHQWLTSQFGLRKLLEHIWMVIGLAKGCQTLGELKQRMAEIYGRQAMQLTFYLPPPTHIAALTEQKPVKSPGKEYPDAQKKLAI